MRSAEPRTCTSPAVCCSVHFFHPWCSPGPSSEIHLCPSFSYSTMAVEADCYVEPHLLNSVLLRLDGTEEEVRDCYTYCQDYIQKWIMQSAGYRCQVEYSEEKVFNVFTTPLRSTTFYYAMNYGGRCLVFIIEGRNGWLHGYYAVIEKDGYQATKGIYEFKSIQKELYINHQKCRRLRFEGNHCDISKKIGNTNIGLHALRYAFDAIWEYNGNKEHRDFESSFGTIVVHICESMKLRPVLDRILEAFTDPTVGKLDIEANGFFERIIRKWSFLSGEAMKFINDHGYQIRSRNVPNISSEQDILTYLTVLYVDGLHVGKFEHDVATNPRQWKPLECGNGVPSVDDIPYLENHTDNEDGGMDKDGENGGRDKDGENGQSGGKQKREGDGRGRHPGHGDSKGKRGGGGGGKVQQGSGGRGGGRKRRGGVNLSVAPFPIIGGWSGEQDKELSMVRTQLKGNATTRSDLNARAGVKVMKESKYPWRQIINNCCLTSLSCYVTNLLQRDLGAVAMTLCGNRLAILFWDLKNDFLFGGREN